MARRSEHSQEQIKEMVLNAAEAIVVKHGVNALTVRKIAVDIGYTVGSIYMVFANMQDLITHIKLRTLDDLASQLQPDAENNPEQQLVLLADQYLSFARQHFNRWQFVFDNTDLSHEMPETYRQKIEQLFGPVESQFRQLKPQAGDADIALAARALWSGVHGICVLYLNGSLGRAGISDSRQAVDLLVASFIRGWQI